MRPYGRNSRPRWPTNRLNVEPSKLNPTAPGWLLLHTAPQASNPKCEDQTPPFRQGSEFMTGNHSSKAHNANGAMLLQENSCWRLGDSSSICVWNQTHMTVPSPDMPQSWWYASQATSHELSGPRTTTTSERAWYTDASKRLMHSRRGACLQTAWQT